MSRFKTILLAYKELCKPRIMLMQLVTVSFGYLLASDLSHFVWTRFLYLLLSTALVASGAGALNHYLERGSDSRMKRTENRPLPAGVLPPWAAFVFGLMLISMGVWIAFVCVQFLTGFLSIMTVFTYLLVYTPLKRLTWWNTFVGAIPGALPPLGGWAAVSGQLAWPAWVLFFILFAWQHPHFYAIAWLYKEDYVRGGFQMLPSLDPTGVRTARQIWVYCLLLILVSPLLVFLPSMGVIYFVGSLSLGIWFLYKGYQMIQSPSEKSAKQLLLASVMYLPALLLVIGIDLILTF